MSKRFLYSLLAALIFGGIMLGMQMLLSGDFINAISVSLVGFIGTLTGCSIGIILAKVFDE